MSNIVCPHILLQVQQFIYIHKMVEVVTTGAIYVLKTSEYENPINFCSLYLIFPLFKWSGKRMLLSEFKQIFQPLDI